MEANLRDAIAPVRDLSDDALIFRARQALDKLLDDRLERGTKERDEVIADWGVCCSEIHSRGLPSIADPDEDLR